MAELTIGAIETLDRLFNAYWREGFAASRRITPLCGGDRRVAVASFPDGSEFLAGVSRLCAMDRIETQPPYYVRRRGGSLEPVDSPEQTLELLPAGSGEVTRLKAEVIASWENLDTVKELSRAHSAEVGLRPGKRFLRSVFNGLGSRLPAPPTAALEGWIVRGHPLHPCAKTRLGFSPEEVLRYSPERGRPIRLRFAAVRRSSLVDTRMPGRPPSDLPPSWERWLDAELADRVLDESKYAVIPVHPWQFERTLPRLFGSEIKAGTIVLLASSCPVLPLISVRTLVPSGVPGACHMKLPIAVQTTSAVRTVSAQSAENGPRLSALIEDLAGGRPDFELLAERRGMYFWDAGAALEDTEALERARHLSAIFRAPPTERPGTWVVPAALLTEPSPCDENPVVLELLEGSGLSAERFFARYARLMGGTLLSLLARGIALEAHAQNTLIRFRDGLPVSFLYRDLGGVRLYRPWLRESRPGLRVHPASVIVAKSVSELVAKTHHTWLQGHLAPLAGALARGCGLPESVLWSAAREAVRDAWAECAADLAPGRVKTLEQALFKPRVAVKALMRMRLGGRSHEYDFVEVENPLA